MLCLLILFVFVTRLSILCLNGPQWDRQWETLKDDRYRYLWRKKFKTTCLYRYPWQRNSDIQTVWIVKTRVLMSKKTVCIFNLLANICRRELSDRSITSTTSWSSCDGKLCSTHAGSCRKHRRRELSLMEGEDERRPPTAHELLSAYGCKLIVL